MTFEMCKVWTFCLMIMAAASITFVLVFGAWVIHTINHRAEMERVANLLIERMKDHRRENRP